MNILFLIFNRPELQLQAFERIREIKPSQLFIAADGPRVNRHRENILCEKARDVVQKVDWNCQVKTLFRDSNLGCRDAVSNAITWFFEHVEDGIILEDDCVPNVSFFHYCEQMLEKYRHVDDVMCISGDNFQDGRLRSDASYYFSAFPHCWGWATWRSAWARYEYDFDGYSVSSLKGTYFDDFTYSQKIFWQNLFDRVAKREVDSWATVWTYSCWLHNGLTALPNQNLVRNVGFGTEATHTKSTRGRVHLSEELILPLKHCDEIHRNVRADLYTSRKIFKLSPLARIGSFFKS